MKIWKLERHDEFVEEVAREVDKCNYSRGVLYQSEWHDSQD